MNNSKTRVNILRVLFEDDIVWNLNIEKFQYYFIEINGFNKVP